MTSPLVIALGFVPATYVFLSALLHLTQDAKEPPVIATQIPFLSPALGFIMGMQNFLVKLRLATLDVFTGCGTLYIAI